MKKIPLLIVIAFSIFVIHFSARGAGAPPQLKNQEIRVLLFSQGANIKLQVKDSFSIYSEDRQLLYKKAFGESLEFSRKENSIFMGTKNLNRETVYVVPKDKQSLVIKGNRYRGMAKITLDPKGHLALINVLGLEDYLMSVVAGEVSPSWPEEVLKAQAVAARTYAYYHMVKDKDKWVDISSPLAQNYQGMEKEHPNTNRAVLETKGELLYYHSYIFPSFFHSTCGGGTEFPQNVWSLNFKIPEVVPCDYCKDSPHFLWNKSYSLNDVENKFRKAGFSVFGLKNIYPSKISKNRSHITEVALISAQGEKRIRVNEFRRILGFNEIKSSKFKIVQKGNSVELNGWGWGHGVGMCQWGARGLAQENKNYKKILSYYYPGSRLKKVVM